MRFEQYKEWPYCGRYLQNWMNAGILEAKSPTVWAAFVRWCGDEEWARTAVRYNDGPLVKILTMPPSYCGEYPHTNNPWGGPPDVVHLSTRAAMAYEGHCSDWVAWESTVLHELVHWARAKAGLDPNIVEDPSGPGLDYLSTEAGKSFEAEAYGQDIQCSRMLNKSCWNR